MAAIKIDPETITVNRIENRVCAISFKTDDARYHVWLDQETGKVTAGFGQKRPTFYKNSLYRSGHPEYFATRYLDAENGANSKVVAELIRLAGPAMAAAQQKLIADKAAEKAADDAEAARVQALDDAITRLDAEMASKGDTLGMYSEQIMADIRLVNAFATRMRGEHNS